MSDQPPSPPKPPLADRPKKPLRERASGRKPVFAPSLAASVPAGGFAAMFAERATAPPPQSFTIGGYWTPPAAAASQALPAPAAAVSQALPPPASISSQAGPQASSSAGTGSSSVSTSADLDLVSIEDSASSHDKQAQSTLEQGTSAQIHATPVTANQNVQTEARARPQLSSPFQPQTQVKPKQAAGTSATGSVAQSANPVKGAQSAKPKPVPKKAPAKSSSGPAPFSIFSLGVLKDFKDDELSNPTAVPPKPTAESATALSSVQVKTPTSTSTPRDSIIRPAGTGLSPRDSIIRPAGTAQSPPPSTSTSHASTIQPPASASSPLTSSQTVNNSIEGEPVISAPGPRDSTITPPGTAPSPPTTIQIANSSVQAIAPTSTSTPNESALSTAATASDPPASTQTAHSSAPSTVPIATSTPVDTNAQSSVTSVSPLESTEAAISNVQETVAVTTPAPSDRKVQSVVGSSDPLPSTQTANSSVQATVPVTASIPIDPNAQSSIASSDPVTSTPAERSVEADPSESTEIHRLSIAIRSDFVDKHPSDRRLASLRPIYPAHPAWGKFRPIQNAVAELPDFGFVDLATGTHTDSQTDVYVPGTFTQLTSAQAAAARDHAAFDEAYAKAAASRLAASPAAASSVQTAQVPVTAPASLGISSRASTNVQTATPGFTPPSGVFSTPATNNRTATPSFQAQQPFVTPTGANPFNFNFSPQRSATASSPLTTQLISSPASQAEDRGGRPTNLTSSKTRKGERGQTIVQRPAGGSLMDALQREDRAKKEIRRTRAQMAAQMEQHEETVRNLNEEIQSLKAQMKKQRETDDDTIHAHEDNRNELEHQLQLRDATIKDADKRYKALEAERENAKGDQAKITQLQGQLEEADRQRIRREKEAKQKHKEYNDRAEYLENRNDKLQRDLSEVTASKTRMRAAYEDLEREREDLEKDLHHYQVVQESYAGLDQQVRDQDEEIECMMAVSAQETLRREGMNTRIADLTADNDRLSRLVNEMVNVKENEGSVAETAGPSRSTVRPLAIRTTSLAAELANAFSPTSEGFSANGHDNDEEVKFTLEEIAFIFAGATSSESLDGRQEAAERLLEMLEDHIAGAVAFLQQPAMPNTTAQAQSASQQLSMSGVRTVHFEEPSAVVEVQEGAAPHFGFSELSTLSTSPVDVRPSGFGSSIFSIPTQSPRTPVAPVVSGPYQHLSMSEIISVQTIPTNDVNLPPTPVLIQVPASFDFGPFGRFTRTYCSTFFPWPAMFCLGLLLLLIDWYTMHLQRHVWLEANQFTRQSAVYLRNAGLVAAQQGVLGTGGLLPWAVDMPRRIVLTIWKVFQPAVLFDLASSAGYTDSLLY